MSNDIPDKAFYLSQVRTQTVTKSLRGCIKGHCYNSMPLAEFIKVLESLIAEGFTEFAMEWDDGNEESTVWVIKHHITSYADFARAHLNNIRSQVALNKKALENNNAELIKLENLLETKDVQNVRKFEL